MERAEKLNMEKLEQVTGGNYGGKLRELGLRESQSFRGTLQVFQIRQ